MAKFTPIPVPERSDLLIHTERTPSERLAAIADTLTKQLTYWDNMHTRANRDFLLGEFLIAEQVEGIRRVLTSAIADTESFTDDETIAGMEGLVAFSLLTRRFLPTIKRHGMTDAKAKEHANFIPEGVLHDEYNNMVPADQPRLHIPIDEMFEEHFAEPMVGGSPSGWWRAGNLIVRQAIPAEISLSTQEYAARVNVAIDPNLQTFYPYLVSPTA